jgi:hypothetical protein
MTSEAEDECVGVIGLMKGYRGNLTWTNQTSRGILNLSSGLSMVNERRNSLFLERRDIAVGARSCRA